MNKQLLQLILSTGLIIALILNVGMASASSPITVILNGETVTFDEPPVLEDDRTLIPLRGTFESIGATVGWEPANRVVTVSNHGKAVRLAIGSKTAYVDGKKVELDVPAQLKNSRTLVPLRFIAETLNGNVHWQGETRSVLITMANESLPTDVMTEPLSESDKETEKDSDKETEKASETDAGKEKPADKPKETPEPSKEEQPAPEPELPVVEETVPEEIPVSDEKRDHAVEQVTVSEVKAKYLSQFSALETKANQAVNKLVSEALAEFEEKQNSDESFSYVEMYTKFSGKAKEIEAEIDQQFNQVYRTLQAELTANGYEASDASEIKEDYESAKQSRRSEIVNQFLN